MSGTRFGGIDIHNDLSRLIFLDRVCGIIRGKFPGHHRREYLDTIGGSSWGLIRGSIWKASGGSSWGICGDNFRIIIEEVFHDVGEVREVSYGVIVSPNAPL